MNRTGVVMLLTCKHYGCEACVNKESGNRRQPNAAQAARRNLLRTQQVSAMGSGLYPHVLKNVQKQPLQVRCLHQPLVQPPQQTACEMRNSKCVNARQPWHMEGQQDVKQVQRTVP